MKRLSFFLLLLLPVFVFAQNNSRQEYIEKYREIAITEMHRTGIPASIKLGQAILESAAGESYLARKGRNHFGIKCGSNWNGKSVHLKDDDYVDGKKVKSCFRKYDNPEQSFIDHSEFLRDPKKQHRYGSLFLLDPQDYKAWAKGLKRSGYATNPYYDKTLIRIIETYELHQYDKPQQVVNVPGGNPIEPRTKYRNQVPVVEANAGETVTSVAVRSGVPLNEVLKYNRGIGGSNTRLNEGDFVYLKPKRRSYRDQRKWHYVQEGETMFSISQWYGIQLKRLYRRNRLDEGSEPAVGERLKLKGWKIKKSETPKVRRPGYQPPNPSRPGDLEMEDDTPPTRPVPPPVERPVVEEDPFDIDESEVNPPENEVPTVPTVPSTPPITDTNGGATVPPTTTTPSAPTVPDEAVYHTVVKGETLYRLFQQYGTPVEEIRRMNGLADNIISIGQRLRVK